MYPEEEEVDCKRYDDIHDTSNGYMLCQIPLYKTLGSILRRTETIYIIQAPLDIHQSPHVRQCHYSSEA